MLSNLFLNFVDLSMVGAVISKLPQVQIDNNTVTLWAAFVAGIISFFSPCILPLIPAYISYMAEVPIDDQSSKGRFLILTRTAGFIIGFTIVFVILGTAATALGGFIKSNMLIFRIVGGIIIVFFGLKMIGIIRLEVFKFASKVKMPKAKGFIGAILMGMALSIGWTPCIGAVLGSILVIAAGQSTLGYGVLLLLIYSAGFAIPFIVVSFVLNIFDKNIAKFEKASKFINLLGGVVLIIIGVLMIFDKLTVISTLYSAGMNLCVMK